MTTETFAPPFEIGQELWMPVGEPRKMTVPCPVCAGAKAITVILGSGEHIGVLCDGCGLGFDGPRGYIEEYEVDPVAVSFTIASVHSFHDGNWTLNSTTGAFHDWKDLYVTEAEALAVAVQRAADQEERNMQSRQRKRKDTQRHGWSVRYHRDCIKDLERQIAWHNSRLLAADKAGK